jgi:adenylyl- and sulfurtransferase ThiI
VTSIIAVLCHVRLVVYSLDQYTEEQKNTLVDCCPTNVFGVDQSTGAVVVQAAQECIFCKECLYAAEEFKRFPEEKLAVSVKHSDSRFTMTVETTGSLLAKDVVRYIRIIGINIANFEILISICVLSG